MTRFLAGICLPLLAACAPESDRAQDDTTASTELAETTPVDQHATNPDRWDPVLAFVNAPDTSFEVLDLDVGLDRRAAERIVWHRDGYDRVAGTDDDNLFDSVDQLLDLDWVGPTSIELIHAWLDDASTDGALVEGVAFTDDEAILVVSLANTADEDYLDLELELDVRAVDGIFDARPIAGLTELSRVPYVGPATLERLRGAVAAQQ